jgi:hypothetical protein
MRRGENHSQHSRSMPSTTYTTALKMADDNPSEKPKKKTKKKSFLRRLKPM